MSKVVLVSDAAFDIVTNYLHEWTRNLLGRIETTGKTIFYLAGVDSNRQLFTKTIEQENPTLVILNGHGSDDLVAGFNNEPLVLAHENPELLSGKIIHALSCSSAKTLGPKSIECGAQAFIGYSEDFEIRYNITNPERDPSALFLEPALVTVEALLRGDTVESAYTISQKMYAKNIELCIQNNSDASNNIAASLFHNMSCQTRLGNPLAVF